MKKFFKFFSLISLILSASFFCGCIFISKNSPDIYNITDDSEIILSGTVTTKVKINNIDCCTNVGSNQTVSKTSYGKLTLFDIFPIKPVKVQLVQENKVTPCGTPFGVKLFASGPVVINLSDVKTEYGIKNPAQENGIKKGDIITSINGNEIKTNEELAQFVENSKGKTINMSIIRDKIKLNFCITPVKSIEDKQYKIGMWVRDSSGGIGTITFYDTNSKIFSGLGHGICDVDTGKLMPLEHGDIMEASIKGIKKGIQGSPGELKGCFIGSKPIGELCVNTKTGIYGTMKSAPISNPTLKVAMKQQVKTGKAKILTTILGENPKYYDINIENINYNESNPTKNILISIKDEELLQKSGGIVQGMSGSPIIQDNMLIGAVTHVFINEPSRGYAIFAETMLNNSYNFLGVNHK